MPPGDPENKIESADSQTSSKVKDTEANKEAHAGKSDLVEKQKEQNDYLKGGGRSGISESFGKPILTELEAVGKKVADEFTKVFKGEQAEALGKAAGDVQKTESKPASAGDAAEAKGDKAKPKPEVVVMDAENITVKAPPYGGKGIEIENDAKTYTGQTGDTLAKIAKDNLPPTATPKQIAEYEQEIAIVNKLDPKNPGDLTGKELNLPGHDGIGGMIIEDKNHVKTTSYTDGTVIIEEPNHRGWANSPDGNGGYEQSHWGPRPGDDFELIKTPDGKFKIKESAEDTAHEVPAASPEVEAERQKLMETAEAKIDDPEKRAKFEADMLRFEERAKNQDPPLSPDEIVKTYKETERLLNATGDTPLKQEDRIALAEQAMSQVANPSSIDQGQHETCNMTTSEVQVYTKHPSDAIKLVTDVATTGEYTTPGGVHVKVDPTAADGEAKNNPPNDGDRSHASQIFQVTAVNLYYQTQPFTYTDAAGNQKVVPAGQLEYKQSIEQPGAVPPVASSEELWDNSTTPPTHIRDWANNKPIESPELADRAMVDVPNLITGTSDTIMIENAKEVYGDGTGVKTFTNQKEMEDYIKQAKADHKLPIVLAVHSGQEPFLHDSGNGAAGGSGGGHVVTITDYDEATGRVKIDNQWGSNADHVSDKGVHISDLYRASQSPERTEVTEEAPWYKPWQSDKVENSTIHELQKVVDWDREHNTIDTQKELELLRLKHKYAGMSDADYQADLKTTLDSAHTRWEQQKADGTFDANEYKNAQTKLQDMVAVMPHDQRVGVYKEMKDIGMIDEKEYVNHVAHETMAYFTDTKYSHTAAESEAFMNKVKALNDGMDTSWQQPFKDFINDNMQDPAKLLDMMYLENKVGMMPDAKYDELMVKTTQDFNSKTHTSAESAAYAARLYIMVLSLPEARRTAVLNKLVPTPATPPAPVPTP